MTRSPTSPSSRRADAFAVAPASANTIAKLAAGICDSFLTTSFLACTAPRIVAPAMNGRMWEAEATQANVAHAARARRRGARARRGSARLARRARPGRMPEPAEILAAIESAAGAIPGRPRRRAASSSPPAAPARRSTRSASSATARAAGWASPSPRQRHAAAPTSTLIAANVALPADPAVERIDVSERRRARGRRPRRVRRADLLLMAAAVADFRPPTRIRASWSASRDGPISLELEPTADVLAGLAAERRDGQVLVGFAAEHGGEFVARARGKLERKGIDAIVVNDVSDSSIGFESARQRGDGRLRSRRRSGSRAAPSASSPTRSSIGSRAPPDRGAGRAGPRCVPTLPAVKDVLILGSTGSIGEQAIDVIGRSAELRIAGPVSADSSWERADRAGRRVPAPARSRSPTVPPPRPPATPAGPATVLGGEEGIRDLIARIRARRRPQRDRRLGRPRPDDRGAQRRASSWRWPTRRASSSAASSSWPSRRRPAPGSSRSTPSTRRSTS